ncbi:hypothetical protein HHI36_021576 [Cryptolaemus montrouzieri]|uniref:C2H2-type domain-containing protein n=1 Tax=Cryptolaemus montrouzieri TaxID=559131 RepID=A0ABD2MYA0_9CUCU
MEISQYDEYVPEKGLDMNFKIPRKRTAEDSFGAQAGEAYAEYYTQANQAVQAAQALQYRQFATSNADSGSLAQYNQIQNAAAFTPYATLSGAASQATAHTNSKPPVQYSAGQAILPPLLSSSFKPNTFSGNAGYNTFNKLPPGHINSNTYSTNTALAPPPPPPPSESGSQSTFSRTANNTSTINQRGGSNSNWASNRNWGKSDSPNSSTQNPDNIGGTRRFGSVRNFGGDIEGNSNRDFSNSGNGGFGSRNRSWGGPTNRNWPNDNPNNFNSRNWGGVSSWEGENRDSYEDQNELNRPNRWSLGRGIGNDPEDNRRNFFNSPRGDFGEGTRGRGQFSSRGGLSDRWGNGDGAVPQREFDRGLDDLGEYGGDPQGFRNENKGFGNDRGFRDNQRGGYGGMGRGGPNQDWKRNTWGGMGGKRGNDDRQGGFGQSRFTKDRPKKPPLPKAEPVQIADAADSTLPKELRELFQPLVCKLCSLDMTSNVMAKLHYSSKNHEKKIRKFLIEHAEKSGEPLHPRALVTAAQKKEKEEEHDPKHFHCDVCDLPLTGKLHAESHYMGRSHNAVVMGKKQPSGKGHYDANGKWVRDKVEKIPVLADGEDTFGLAFRKKPESSSAPAAPSTDPADKPEPGQFTCSICNVSCTCQEQINMHFNGARHKKKLKSLGIRPENFEPPQETKVEGASETSNTEEKTPTGDAKDAEEVTRNDFSKYKTPSGYYYCGQCNLALNSEIQLQQHLTSKNHLKNGSKKIES